MSEQLRFEIKRKIFHIFSIIFPLLYLYNSKVYILQLLFFLTTVVIFLDILRKYITNFNQFIIKIFRPILRPEEMTNEVRVSGVSYMLLGFLITAIIFDKGLCINCWLVLIVSDAVASLFGIKFGFEEIISDKTVVGSSMFLMFAVFISLISVNIVHYNTKFYVIIISSFMSTLAELFSKKIGINDNLSIPIVFGLTTLILRWLY